MCQKYVLLKLYCFYNFIDGLSGLRCTSDDEKIFKQLVDNYLRHSKSAPVNFSS